MKAQNSFDFAFIAGNERIAKKLLASLLAVVMGLPMMYRDMTMIWEGRELSDLLTADSKMVYYEYDANGLRTKKTVDGVVTEYVWLGDMLIREQTGTNVTYYLYDENGAAIGFEYNGTPYYYLKNIQGDVVSIVDNSGVVVVNYTYNAWGEIVSIIGTMADTIGQVNKLRYRSYYYDSETGFYYLQSRYYDPIVKRFISPDSTDYLTANGAFGGFNLYVYCANDPVNNIDSSGTATVSVTKYKDRFWLAKLVGKYIPNVSSDSIVKKTLFNKKLLGVKLEIQVAVAAQSNANALFGGTFKKGKLINISSFVPINDYLCFSFSPKVTWKNISFELGLSYSPVNSGLCIGISVELSVSHITTAAIIASCVAVPYMSTFMSSVAVAVKSSATAAASRLVPLLSGLVYAIA